MEKHDKIGRFQQRQGILNPPPSEPERFRLARYPPARELADFIEHYWIVAWDLSGCAGHTQETLPDPNFHVVFEAKASYVYGVVTGKFSRYLEGRSRVFGIRFAPGMFRAYLQSSARELADKTVPAHGLFGDAVNRLASILGSSDVDEKSVVAANDFFCRRIPPADENAELAKRLVRQILEDRDIRSVADLARRAALGQRTVQRLFHEYVGVSPKWVIRRYRLHEAVERFRAGEAADFAQMALDLGYFDQAHLINDFRSIVGYSPRQFRDVVCFGGTHIAKK